MLYCISPSYNPESINNEDICYQRDTVPYLGHQGVLVSTKSFESLRACLVYRAYLLVLMCSYTQTHSIMEVLSENILGVTDMWVSRLTKEDRHWMYEHPPVGKGPERADRKKVRYVHNHSLTIAFLAGMLAHRYKILHSLAFEYKLVPCLSRRIPGLQSQTTTASFPCPKVSNFLN